MPGLEVREEVAGEGKKRMMDGEEEATMDRNRVARRNCK